MFGSLDDSLWQVVIKDAATVKLRLVEKHLRRDAPRLSEEQAQQEFRRLLRFNNVPHANEAYVRVLKLGAGSHLGWDKDTNPNIPVLRTSADMLDSVAVCVVATHAIRNYADPGRTAGESYGPEFFQTLREVLIETGGILAWEFDQESEALDRSLGLALSCTNRNTEATVLFATYAGLRPKPGEMVSGAREVSFSGRGADTPMGAFYIGPKSGLVLRGTIIFSNDGPTTKFSDGATFRMAMRDLAATQVNLRQLPTSVRPSTLDVRF